ncbi:hypothetical protein B0H34DRAFT_702908 [Crassisporium funariophilum]|nr:hypothetical protein B0H34DRAFT_702908 [Crassisporium funariophilum]
MDQEIVLSPYALNVHHEYSQWDDAHAKMIDKPPPEGRDYLKHARRLLPLLEGVAELHPFAKAAISSFKAVILYEQDRQENDARVTTVFLSQTDMMRVLLDVDNLHKRRRSRSDSDISRSNAVLEELLYRIQKEIKACANSIDTYYKESRFVKFWKAHDWKDRMLWYIDEFNKYRILLQQTLSIHIASGVNDLVSKMDAVLTRLFVPQHDWEKDLVDHTRQLGDPSGWIRDTTTLQNLAIVAREPMFGLSSVQGDPAAENLISSASVTDFRIATLLVKMKEDLSFTLDNLCERNMNAFELKLNFHTQQVQEAIANSAEFVVRTLSGPHDRLFNENLRELWKEMNWIFCVENSLFTSALFEYYLDQFSSSSITTKLSDSRDKGINAAASPLTPEAPKIHTVSNISSFLSKVGFLPHADAWTLEYIALHGQRISQAIDRDRSGFIRISEANAFAEQIPSGWNLPQWCAYTAAGWLHEARIYRARMRSILFKLHEMHPRVLAPNRGYVLIAFLAMSDLYHCLAREPRGQKFPPVSHELRNLVKDKVIAQDATFRARFASLDYTIDDESTVHLLFGDKPLETYILQLITIVLEETWKTMEICSEQVVDLREWERLVVGVDVVGTMAFNRISVLNAQHEQGQDEKLDMKASHYYGGIWYFLDQGLRENLRIMASDIDRHSTTEIEDHYSNLDIFDDFPLPKISSASLPYLKYGTWEAHLQSTNAAVIPDSIPKSWTSQEGVWQILPERGEPAWQAFPLHLQRCCDACEILPMINLDCYTCLECYDFDLCAKCYALPEDKHCVEKHQFTHPVIRCALLNPTQRRDWLIRQANDHLKKLQQECLARENTTAPTQDETTDASQSNDQLFTCGQCAEPIPLDSTFYSCFEYACHGYYRCEKCVDLPIGSDGQNSPHKSWHALLVLRKNLFDKTVPQPVALEVSPEDVAPKTALEDPIVSAISSRILNLEDKINSTRSMLEDGNAALKAELVLSNSEVKQELAADNAALKGELLLGNLALEKRISRLESKIDSNLEEMKTLFADMITQMSQR